MSIPSDRDGTVVVVVKLEGALISDSRNKRGVNGTYNHSIRFGFIIPSQPDIGAI